jgi:hypothetical protein
VGYRRARSLNKLINDLSTRRTFSPPESTSNGALPVTAPSDSNDKFLWFHIVSAKKPLNSAFILWRLQLIFQVFDGMS